ncbi:MAG: hypothetical protein A2Y53_01710 [Chloroflexi bacterium RBG_16_47_49]|nr:MAG: hypothetical protein A2Y53_01710 [Chloroflexi bacterium RBG_16_47_49]
MPPDRIASQITKKEFPPAALKHRKRKESIDWTKRVQPLIEEVRAGILHIRACDLYSNPASLIAP